MSETGTLSDREHIELLQKMRAAIRTYGPRGRKQREYCDKAIAFYQVRGRAPMESQP